MKCSIFIGTSADGYIATEDGSVAWLEQAGDVNANMGSEADMGFNSYIQSVDCMIMGRKCLDMLSSFNLTDKDWPYGNIRIYAMSRSIKEAPKNIRDRVEMFNGEITDLVSQLEDEGFKHAYIDGGATITSFLNKKLLNELHITRAPILLGSGKPLFGKLDNSIKLINAKAKTYPNGFVQQSYNVEYEPS